ncbi:hypothetical protein HK100_011139, partial [Physocladia obscura]
MSTRTFIHNALYNKNYGYFSKNARIFTVPNEAGIPFATLRDGSEFLDHLAHLYNTFDKSLDENTRQVWHTPTELFKPHYANSVASYILKEYVADNNEPLRIYEVGAGNGTMCSGILDFLKQHHPKIYQRTEYVIIEISTKLAGTQKLRVSGGNESATAKIGGHRVNVINKSIFEWSNVVPDKCFVIAMEDNFSHDLVRYTQDTGEPVQGIVLIDQDGDFQEAFEPLSDSYIKEYLELRDKWNGGAKRPKVLSHPILRKISSLLPFGANLSQAEFLPTMNMRFMQILHQNFPKHRLILSDFCYLPDTVPGHMGPVVQTRYKGAMVPCSTYLVQPGWFDIFFPTDFEEMAKMYTTIGNTVDQESRYEQRKTQILTQKEFLVENAVGLEACRTKSGEIPMLDFYENFKFL